MTSPVGDGFCVQYAEQFSGIVSVVVGGSFEVWAGNVRRAPQWMQRAGVEWTYRLVQEPGRLFWRYASTNTRFVVRVWLQRLSDLLGGRSA